MNRRPRLSAALLLLLTNALSAATQLSNPPYNASSSLIQNIDTKLGKRYEDNGFTYSSPNKEWATFEEFCTENQYDSDAVSGELEEGYDLCGLLDFFGDDRMSPLVSDIKNEKTRAKKLFQILKQCAGLEAAPNDGDDEKEEEPISAKSLPKQCYFRLSLVNKKLEKCVSKHRLLELMASFPPNDAVVKNLFFGLYFDERRVYSSIFFLLFSVAEKSLRWKELTPTYFRKEIGYSIKRSVYTCIDDISKTKYKVGFLLDKEKFATVEVDFDQNKPFRFTEVQDIWEKNTFDDEGKFHMIYHFNREEKCLYMAGKRKGSSQIYFTALGIGTGKQVTAPFSKNSNLRKFRLQKLIGGHSKESKHAIFTLLLLHRKADVYCLTAEEKVKSPAVVRLGIHMDALTSLLQNSIKDQYQKDYRLINGKKVDVITSDKLTANQLQIISIEKTSKKSHDFLLKIARYHTKSSKEEQPTDMRLYLPRFYEKRCRFLPKNRVLMELGKTSYCLIDLPSLKYYKLSKESFDPDWHAASAKCTSYRRNQSLEVVGVESDAEQCVLDFQLFCCRKKATILLKPDLKGHYTSFCQVKINIKENCKPLHMQEVSLYKNAKNIKKVTVCTLEDIPGLAKKIYNMSTPEAAAIDSENETDDGYSSTE